MSAESFVGTWKLREACALAEDGRRIASPLGEKVLGIISYDAAGNMAAQLMGAPRARFSARTPDDTPAEEFKAAFLSFTSYWGTYRIDSAAQAVIHTVEGASAPSWVGSEQLRYFERQGNLLTLKTPPIRGRDGVKQVQLLVWEKVA